MTTNQTSTPQDTDQQTAHGPQDGEQATNPPNPQQDAQQPASGEQATGDQPAGDDTRARGKGNSEAAKYRTRLREAEEQRDTLTAQLGTAREIILNNHLAAQGIQLKATGIQKLGYNTADLLNDDLSINTDALTTTLEGIADAGFTYKNGRSAPVRKSGTGGGTGTGGSVGPSWGGLLNRD